MRCIIYKSLKKTDMYLYLREDAPFESLPAALLGLFGRAEEVMRLELSSARRLVREDVVVVIENLTTQGYHLQLPPVEA